MKPKKIVACFIVCCVIFASSLGHPSIHNGQQTNTTKYTNHNLETIKTHIGLQWYREAPGAACNLPAGYECLSWYFTDFSGRD